MLIKDLVVFVSSLSLAAPRVTAPQVAARPRTAIRFGVLALTLGVAFAALPVRASADAKTDYLHYLVGSYADFGASQAKVFHHQVEGQGTLDLATTKTALDELSDTITSVAAWMESIRRMQPAEENQKAGRHVAEIRALATKAEELTRALQASVDAAIEADAETASDDLVGEMKGPIAELFQTFGAMQKAHESIATKLELAELPDPSE